MSILFSKIKQTLSYARLSTYEAALCHYPMFQHAIELYQWNAEVAAAFLFPAHICEITIRNAIAEAIAEQYGARWPYSSAFIRSLPGKSSKSLRTDLETVLYMKKIDGSDVSQIIAQLRFVFWQQMLTNRFEQNIWQKRLTQVFPHLPTTQNWSFHREQLYLKLDRVRKLRNQIAHHEPIFDRDLETDLECITELIYARCTHTAHWMLQHQKVTPLLNKIIPLIKK